MTYHHQTPLSESTVKWFPSIIAGSIFLYILQIVFINTFAAALLSLTPGFITAMLCGYQVSQTVVAE